MSIPTTETDGQLVTASLTGNHAAFGQIVTRYQSLVCALAFSATGSVSRSEDLAQETFVTAWRQLATLREPGKFRAWLCGVARNVINADLRRQVREPAYRAEPLMEADVLPAAEPAPAAQAVTNEEIALLWREIGQLPEIYREPLVLYYREQQSVAHVAAALELSEEAVMQRLSRGRKLLHERMLAFVEGALARTGPRPDFMLGVQAALPVLTVGSQAAGVASAKGMALKGGGGLTAFLLPFIGLFAALGVSWAGTRAAPAGAARRFMVIWNAVLWGSIGALLLGLRGVAVLSEERHWDLRSTLQANVALWSGYLAVLVTLLAVMYRRGVSRAAHPGDCSAPPTRNGTALVVGTYVATTAWIIGFAWLMGDSRAALLVAGGTVALAAWHFRARQSRVGVAAHRLDMGCHAVLCVALLLLANLRLGHWVAPLYGTSAGEMRRLLPLAAIHQVSLGLLAWTAVLLWFPGRAGTAAKA